MRKEQKSSRTARLADVFPQVLCLQLAHRDIRGGATIWSLSDNSGQTRARCSPA
jgi:hypothetical protein